MWNIDEAIIFIRQYQQSFRQFNYHIGLIGSVLNDGISIKDLDIVVLPMSNGKEANIKLLIPFLEEHFAAAKIIDKEYEFDGRILMKSFINDKRIDWFIYTQE